MGLLTPGAAVALNETGRGHRPPRVALSTDESETADGPRFAHTGGAEAAWLRPGERGGFERRPGRPAIPGHSDTRPGGRA